MSLHPQPIGPVPADTARVARAALPKGNVYLTIRDHIGVLFDDELFEPLFAPQGQPAEAPWRLALVCVLQCIEGLSDRQAAEAVRDRLAWKYLLGLELTDTGFHYSVLSEFRDRLIAGGLELTLLDTMLAPFKDRGWLKGFRWVLLMCLKAVRFEHSLAAIPCPFQGPELSNRPKTPGSTRLI